MAEQSLPDRSTIRADIPVDHGPALEPRTRALPSAPLTGSLLPLGLFLALALVGPWLGGDATGQDLANRLQAPTPLGGDWNHPLGTDSLGRDLLARILEGARLSLLIGLAAASISALLGVSFGLLAGVWDGLIDSVVTTVVELCLAIPTIVIGIVLVATLGQSLPNLLAILVISGWIGYARVVRLQARALLHADFITAAIASGATAGRIAFTHLLPNVWPQVVVIFCQQVAAVMVWEASLTYLGVGLPIERISLGGLIREGQDHVFDGWWIAFMPGLAIALAVIGFNLLADWIQGQSGQRRRSTRSDDRDRRMTMGSDGSR